MFYFNIGDLAYRVRFEYIKDSEDRYVGTIASLQSAKLGSSTRDFLVVGSGVAYCSSRDQFCKETGRKLALSRTLLDIFQDRSIRRLAWQAYFARKQKLVIKSEPVGC